MSRILKRWAEEVFQKALELPDSGGAMFERSEIETLPSNVVLKDIIWGTDQGNWRWDGAVLALEVVGIPVDRPLDSLAETPPV